jgi:serine protease
MKKTHAILLVFFMVVFACGPLVSADDAIRVRTPKSNGPEYVQGEFLVQFKGHVSEKAIEAFNNSHGATVRSVHAVPGFLRMSVPQGKTAEGMVEIYSKNRNVEYAELNYIAHTCWTPTDDFYSFQWHLDNAKYGGIQLEDAFDYIETTGGSYGAGVVVAVVDTGVAASEEMPADRLLMLPGSDFVNFDNDPTDDEGHGTHVAGTIAQETNNGGVAGIAFDATIMPVKVLSSEGSGSYAAVADGIVFAANNGAHVINMSLGGPVGSQTLENALAYAHDMGVTIVCASGNDGSRTAVSYPAAYDDYCIAVGATKYEERIASYSNQGASLDLTAPGGYILTDRNRDGYGDGVLQYTFGSGSWGYFFYQGTSMASPHVAGVAALLIANGVATTPAEVQTALEMTAEDKGDAGWDSIYGYGIVDAFAALQWQGTTPPPPDTGDTIVVTAVVTAEGYMDGRFERASATAVVTVTDEAGNPLDGAVVSGYWSGAASDADEGQTDNGTVTFESDSARKVKKALTFTFTVTEVLLEGYMLAEPVSASDVY